MSTLTIHDAITGLRRTIGPITQECFAEEWLHISRHALINYEKDRVPPVTVLARLQEIVDALETPQMVEWMKNPLYQRYIKSTKFGGIEALALPPLEAVKSAITAAFLEALEKDPQYDVLAIGASFNDRMEILHMKGLLVRVLEDVEDYVYAQTFRFLMDALNDPKEMSQVRKVMLAWVKASSSVGSGKSISTTGIQLLEKLAENERKEGKE